MLTEKNALNIWLKNILPDCDYKLTKLAGDASFRQYYRVQYQNNTRILMDSSADQAAFATFTKITQKLANAELPVPQIFASEQNQAFALLEDFGDDLLLYTVNEQNADTLYKSALDLLLQIQKANLQTCDIPKFDSSFMHVELQRFEEWFIQRHLKIELTNAECGVIKNTFAHLEEVLQTQPYAFSHMDYHSRNIICTDQKKLGIIDYQDAMYAPCTYDLVSLLKDCYIQWPLEKVHEWLSYFYDNSELTANYSKPEFIKAFDLCGLQRHLKVLGIFSRLYLRDNKASYLKSIPLVFHYILACLECYNELNNFAEVIREKIYPSFKYEKRNDSSRGTR